MMWKEEALQVERIGKGWKEYVEDGKNEPYGW